MLHLNWKDTFIKFLKILPLNEEDGQLLTEILKFLNQLVPMYKYKGKIILKNILVYTVIIFTRG